MKITWYGHSCFLLTAENGVSILTDPCGRDTGYTLHDIACDAVTVSHDHYDHNCLGIIAGSPQVIQTVGEHRVGDIPVTGFATFHDEVHGAKRGPNIVFRYVIDDLRLVHLGDLGHMPDDELIGKIGSVDVLFIPVGGVYTIDSRLATRVSEALRPRVLIPMHYKTPALRINIDGLDPLLAANTKRSVHRLNASTCTLTRETLGDNRLLLLDYKR